MAKSKITYISNPLELIKPSATALGKNFGALVGLMAIMVVAWMAVAGSSAWWIIEQLSNGFDNPFNIALWISIGLAVVAALVSLLLYPASNIVLIASAQNKKIGIKQALSSARPFIWRTLGVSILTMLAVLGGLILFIIPGLIFLAWFFLSSYVVVNENLGVVESMKRSKQLVKGRVWEMFGLIMLPTAAGIIPFVGGIVSFVISIIMIPATAIRYIQLAETKPEDRPEVHWSNYGVIVAAALAGTVSNSINANSYTDKSF